MFCLTMELVGNCSFTLSTTNGKWDKLPSLKIGVLQGSGLAPLLLNIYTSYPHRCPTCWASSQRSRTVSSSLGHGVWTPAPLSAHVHPVQMHDVSNWETHLSLSQNN